MNPNINQQPDKSAAGLAFATMLSENLLRQQNPMQTEEEPMQEESLDLEEPTEEETLEPEEEIEETPEQEVEEEQGEEVEDESSQKIDELSKSFDEFKGEMKGMIDAKLGDLTQSIKDAIK